MRLKFLFPFLLIFGITTTWACDPCGSTIGGASLSLLGNYRSNIVGLQWAYTPYESISEFSNGSKDQFRSLDLFIRWQPFAKWKLMFRQPYHWNLRTDIHNTTQKLNGFGDTEMNINYAVIDNQLLGKTILLYWEIGAGIKLPTAAYEYNLDSGDLPENFNLGNGSYAYITQSNFVLSRFNTGIAGSFRYQWNKKNTEGYDFGNQLKLNALIFHQLVLSDTWNLTPSLGNTYEEIALDRLPRGNISPRTGGKGLFLTAGSNFRWKDKWQVGINYQHPISDNYAGDTVGAKARWSVELSFLL